MADEANSTRRPWRDWLPRLLGFILVGALIAGLGYALIVYSLVQGKGPYEGRGRLEYTKEAWFAAKDSLNGERYLMLGDLLETEPLEGLTRSELEALLGPLIAPPEYSGGAWRYYLGPDPSWMSVENIWLGFGFDESDRVVEVDTFTD